MRFDFAPLERLARAQLPMATDDGVAGLLGTTRRQMYRWREYGVTADQADKLALRLDLHPVNVWPDYGKRACGARGCTQTFVPYRSNQKWCSRRCWKRERERRRYQRDPEFAAAENARARAYYAECAATIKAKQRVRLATRCPEGESESMVA